MVAHESMEPAYLQPVAVHGADVTRMIACDPDGGWWLWWGDHSAQPLEPIPEVLASWMLCRAEMQLLPLPRLWFPRDALPVQAEVDLIAPPGNGD